MSSTWRLMITSETLSQGVIAQDQRLPINAAKYPARYEGVGDLVERYVAGFRRLLGAIDRFKVIDQSTEASIEQIESAVKNHRTTLLDENKTVIVVIDNFHDSRSDSRNFDATTTITNTWPHPDQKEPVNTYQVPVILYRELRKLNGNKRPTMEDVRETTKIGYAANLIWLVYNERLALDQGRPDLLPGRKKAVQSVRFFEVQFGKNKLSSFKGRLFYHLSLNLAI